jgi:hypothetical protein
MFRPPIVMGEPKATWSELTTVENVKLVLVKAEE